LTNPPETYEYLLEDQDFKRWFTNIKRGSPSYAYELRRRMGYIHRQFKKSPKDIASMTPKQAGNFILDVVTELEKEKLSGKYIGNYVKALKNWLEYNDVHVTQKVKVSDELVKVGDEIPPIPDELKKILLMGDFRARAVCGIVAFTGVRLEVLGNFLGDDGLKIKDFPEMTVKGKTVDYAEVPTLVAVRKSLSKSKKPYFTFLCEEGCEYLKQYLEWRLQRGEKLVPDSPLVTPYQMSLAGQHIRTANIGDMMRKAIRAAGFQWRPYVLRRYYDTRMMLAESDRETGMIRDYRVFFMGHSGDMEATYTVNKGLSKDIIRKMRESYEKAADKYLATTRRKEEVTKETVVQTFNRQFLQMAGYSEDEIDKLGDLSQKSPQDIQDLIKKRSMEALGLNGNKQRIVAMDEVKNYVVQGWEFVTTLPSNEAVIRLPT
jgi:PAS domain-containing protein